MFCTPHYRSQHFHAPRADARTAYRTLQQQLAEHRVYAGTGLDLVLGAEVHLAPDLADDLQADAVPTLGDTRYVLVEFPNDALPPHALHWVHELVARGLHPIMAHPERHVVLRRQPHLVHELMAQGLSMQLTAQCFANSDVTDAAGPSSSGAFSEVRHHADEFAWDLLASGCASVIASDAHGTTRRPPLLKTAYESIAEHFGQAVTDMLIANANAIWDDALVERVVPQARPQKPSALLRPR